MNVSPSTSVSSQRSPSVRKDPELRFRGDVHRDLERIPQPGLVRAIGQAYGWLDDILKRGQTIEEVAAQAGMTAPRVSYLLHLTRLGPAVVRAVLTGAIDEQVTIKDLHKAADHLDWSLQAAALNING